MRLRGGGNYQLFPTSCIQTEGWTAWLRCSQSPVLRDIHWVPVNLLYITYWSFQSLLRATENPALSLNMNMSAASSHLYFHPLPCCASRAFGCSKEEEWDLKWVNADLEKMVTHPGHAQQFIHWCIYCSNISLSFLHSSLLLPPISPTISVGIHPDELI